MNSTADAHPLDPSTVRRALGVILGAAVGDALGAPFEFGPAGRYRARFPEPVVGGIGEMIGGGGFDWSPGEFTDDTQMAVAMAHSCGRFPSRCRTRRPPTTQHAMWCCTRRR